MYILPVVWIQSWQSFLEGKGPLPQKIDLKPLAEKIMRKEDIDYKTHYLFADENLWLFLIKRYGGGPIVSFKKTDLDQEDDRSSENYQSTST